MWTSDTMGFVQSLMISGMGLLVVLCALSLLAVMIVLFSKAFALASGRKAPAAPAAPAPQGLSQEETGAMLIAAVCEELRTDPKELCIKSIREL